MRLIDADELWKHKFKSASERMDLEVAYMGGWNDAIDSIDENAPTVDAEPVKHGHWTEIDRGLLWQCSECEHHSISGGHYCDWCGCKMDEVEK